MSRDACPFCLCTANHRRTSKFLAVSDTGSQLSLTPSQSASQILLPGSDDDSADPPARPVFDEPRIIDIPAAHSIDDHDAMHANIPSSRPIVEGVKQKAESSDSDQGGKLEVRMNQPFAHPQSSASPPRRPKSEKRHTLTAHPSHSTTAKSASTSRPSSAHQLNVRLHKQKPASDIGAGATLVAFKSGDVVGTPYTRAPTSSGSLLGTITGLFKGKRASMEYGATYNGPMAGSFANGWQTRTGRNLARARAQGSSSEEDLPSSVKRRSRAFGVEEGVRAPKRGSTTPPPIAVPPKSSRVERSPDKGKGRVLLAIPNPTPATGYAPQMTLERTSSSARSRETAANTALNARTNANGGSFHNGEHSSLGRSDSKWSATSSGNASERRRDFQTGRPLYTVDVTRQSQSGGSRPHESISSGGGRLVLSPAKLEVVRAPPSVTQAPVLLGPSPSPLVLPSRKASSGPGSRGAPSPPPKNGIGNTGVAFLPAQTPPRGGVLYSTAGNGEPPRPLKSALRNSSLSPSPSPAPAIHGSAKSSTPSSSGTPTMPTGARPPEIISPIPRPHPPPPMPSEVLPRPNRLSEIPASNRTSIVSENEYETCVEEFVDAEEGTESDTPPAVSSPPLPPLPPFSASEKAKHPPPEGEHQPSLPAQRTLDNGSPPVDASVSSTSTQRRKSVRMIIHPTVTVSAPEEYTEPPTPPAHDRGKEYEWFKSHSRSTSGTSHRSETSRSAVPSAWETRVEHQKSVWDNSDPEDDGYRAAKRALQRASAL